jgi:hypothetical protein
MIHTIKNAEEAKQKQGRMVSKPWLGQDVYYTLIAAGWMACKTILEKDLGPNHVTVCDYWEKCQYLKPNYQISCTKYSLSLTTFGTTL